jgi:hypothetical protein
MMFKVGLENNTEGRSQAWILGHPGCFSYGKNGPEALAAAPRAIQEYRQWILSHTADSWFPGANSECQLAETWECYTIDENYKLAPEGYEVNAWFRHDWLPLTDEDIQHGLLLLAWGRQALWSVAGSLDEATLERTYPSERWSITGILKHIGSAEWWYMDRLGLAFDRSEVPEQAFQRLEKVRKHLVEVLPGLAGARQVVGISGEFWSPRKLLRRAIWHEYDHIAHIRKLL